MVHEGGEHILREAADTAVLARHGLVPGRFALVVGTKAAHKGLAGLAEAQAMLASRGLVLAVAGATDAAVFRQGGDPAGQAVVPLGRVSDAELRALYEAALCLIFPSRYEGFGLPPLEAMTCGCPVIAADAAAVPEVCGDAALWFDNDGPRRLPDALARLLDEAGLAATLRTRGLARARRLLLARRRRNGWWHCCPGAARMKVALVHEWLESYAGSERVLEQLLAIWPEADLFAVCDFLPAAERGFLGGRTVTTSFIQRLPFARRMFRNYLGLMPLAIEQLDLSGYDLVVSSSHAVAKGVLTGPGQLHVSYIHSPMRYAWDLQHQYLRQARHGARAEGRLYPLAAAPAAALGPQLGRRGRQPRRQQQLHRRAHPQGLAARLHGHPPAGRRDPLQPGRGSGRGIT